MAIECQALALLTKRKFQALALSVAMVHNYAVLVQAYFTLRALTNWITKYNYTLFRSGVKVGRRKSARPWHFWIYCGGGVSPP